MTRKFLLVGLTGGVATGKSTVAEILRRLGCVIIDADVVAREVVAPGEPAHDDIVAEFGRGILQRDGTLDRQKLGVIVFAVPEKRKRLEAITHPRIRERLARRLEELAARGFAGIVVFDAPLIIESGNATTMDRLVVVVTDEATQAPRLTARDGPGAAEALTGELARRAGRVVALEIDRGLVEGLRARVPSVEVIEADARVWDYGALARPRDGRVLVVGNLPYSVGKPILAALIAARTAIDEMALMLQREVAERVAAAPGAGGWGGSGGGGGGPRRFWGRPGWAGGLVWAGGGGCRRRRGAGGGEAGRARGGGAPFSRAGRAGAAPGPGGRRAACDRAQS